MFVDRKLKFTPDRGWLIVKDSVLTALHKISGNTNITLKLSNKPCVKCPACGLTVDSLCSSFCVGETEYVFHDRLLRHCITEHNMSLPRAFVADLLAVCGIKPPRRIVIADANGVNDQRFFNHIKSIEHQLSMLLIQRKYWEGLIFKLYLRTGFGHNDRYDVITVKRQQSKWFAIDHTWERVDDVGDDWFVEPVNLIERSDIVMNSIVTPEFWKR